MSARDDERDAGEERAVAELLAAGDGPELPILAAVRDELLARVAAAGAPAQPRRQGRPRGRGVARRDGGRVARRTVVLAILVFLIGATAIAATSLVGHPPPTTDPTTLTTSGSGLARETLSAYGRGARACVLVRAGENVASACARPPAADGLRALSAHGPLARFVVGLAGERVLRVRVRVGASVRTVATAPLPASGDLPGGIRWFSARFAATPRDTDEPPATLVPLDGGGRPLRRPPLLDCSLGAAARACRAAAERAATGHG